MTDRFAVDKSNKVRQLSEYAQYDKASVYAILDVGLVAHVAFMQDGLPVVVPMIYGRDNDTVYLHGARKARIIRLLEQTDRACLNVTLIDGIVYARSVFNSSMNYRSVTVHGTPTMQRISEHVMPGRWNEVRDSHEREGKMTGVIALTIDAASAKVTDGHPVDEEEDYSIPIWAGVLPVTTHVGERIDADRLVAGVEASDVVLSMQNRKL